MQRLALTSMPTMSSTTLLSVQSGLIISPWPLHALPSSSSSQRLRNAPNPLLQLNPNSTGKTPGPCSSSPTPPGQFSLTRTERHRCPSSSSSSAPSSSSSYSSYSSPHDPAKQQRVVTAMGLPVGAPEAADTTQEGHETESKLLNPKSIVIPVGDREITIETGRMGRHTSGAVTVRDGDTMLYCTACADFEPAPAGDFAPLSVTYQERFSAAGRTSGGYFKREGKTKDHEVLVSRLMDRPVRPMIAKGFNYETQILAWVLSYDEEYSPDALALVAAGAALAVSDIPLEGIVSGVRVGLVDGQFIINPRVHEMAKSELDLVVAGTHDSVLMIEGYCNFLTEEQLLEAVEFGQKAISKICEALSDWVSPEGQGVGKPKRRDPLAVPPPELEAKIAAIVAGEVDAALRISVKKERGKAMGQVEQRCMEHLTAEGRAKWRAQAAAAAAASAAALLRRKEEEEAEQWDEEEGFAVDDGEIDEGEIHIKVKNQVPANALVQPDSRAHWDDATDQMYAEADVKRALKSVISKTMRRLIVVEGVRSDGRGISDVRPIESSCGLLPRVHGSALFSRGETQSLAVAVLGSDDMAQRLDNLVTLNDTKRFYLHYSFPPSSVGETGRVGAPSRREVGHGALAERALEPCIPDSDTFPYSVRLESNITESNGSSSMASVCGGCLALQDAGVPLKSTVAGVAMGLILKTAEVGGTGAPVILTDILGSEDALGDMDFKVAGNETGVTAFQMDIKVTGITMEVLRTALDQAKAGRIHVLNEMAKCNPPPRMALSQYAPRCEKIKIDPEKINLVIGAGGKVIRSIIEDTKVENIDIQDSGQVTIYAKTDSALQKAKGRIQGLTMEPEVGTIYRGCAVKSILPFGCFVELAPGKEGLVHISELAVARLEKCEDAVTVGQSLDVKLLEINSRGQLRLSHKAVLIEEQGGGAADAGASMNGTSGGQSSGGGGESSVNRTSTGQFSGSQGAKGGGRPNGKWISGGAQESKQSGDGRVASAASGKDEETEGGRRKVVTKSDRA